MSSTLQLRLPVGQASLSQLRSCIDQLLSELPDSDAANTPGVSDLRDRSLDVTVAEEGDGLDPFVSTLLVTIAAEVSVETLKAVWTHYLLPGIRRRIGVDAVGDPATEESEPGDSANGDEGPGPSSPS